MTGTAPDDKHAAAARELIRADHPEWFFDEERKLIRLEHRCDVQVAFDRTVTALRAAAAEAFEEAAIMADDERKYASKRQSYLVANSFARIAKRIRASAGGGKP